MILGNTRKIDFHVAETLKTLTEKSLSSRRETQVVAVSFKGGIDQLETACAGVAYFHSLRITASVNPFFLYDHLIMKVRVVPIACFYYVEFQ